MRNLSTVSELLSDSTDLTKPKYNGRISSIDIKIVNFAEDNGSK